MRRRRWLRLGVGALGALVALAASVAGLGFYWLSLSPSRTSGSIAVAGLDRPAEIRRDRDGLVLVRADGERDAYFALGFAHAQDRLFQMDLWRRAAAGRLAEILGERAVESDRLMRVLGLYRRAEANVALLAPEVVAALEAYAAGVNAFIATHRGPWPPEFHLLRYRPQPWRPADTLAWGRLLALQLSGNWRDEALRLRLARLLDPARLEALWPAAPESDAAGMLGDRPRAASNNWAVAGRRTASGKPLLANDPHLPLAAPIQWYLARIETPGLSVTGGTLPGNPFVLVGHNGRVAWGVTTTQGDTQDLFVERLAPDGRYQTPDGPRAFDRREEVILVRGGEPIAMTVRESRHGPVVVNEPGEEIVHALAWTCLAEDDRTVEAVYRMNRAADAAEFRAALRDFHCPQQNVVYADVEGAIGFLAAGRVPVRKSIHAGSQMPAPGWSGDYDWLGLVPFAELPQSADPPAGWVGTANNRIVEPGYPHFIAARWEPPHRIRRIGQFLADASGLALDDMASMQQDTLSLAASELLPRMLAGAGAVQPPEDAGPRVALALLEAWNFRMERNQAAPLIYIAWRRAFERRAFADDLGEAFDSLWHDGLAELALRPGAVDWCDDAETPETESCERQLAAALDEAVSELAAAYGERPEDWRWGEAHPAVFVNRILGRLPLVGGWVSPAIATSGGADTLNRAVPAQGPDALFPNVHGSGLRAIFDLAQLERSRFIVATGQSGNPFSHHYADLMGRWRDGAYLSMVEIEGESLILLPEQP